MRHHSRTGLGKLEHQVERPSELEGPCGLEGLGLEEQLTIPPQRVAEERCADHVGGDPLGGFPDRADLKRLVLSLWCHGSVSSRALAIPAVARERLLWTSLGG